ncbi:hypothetical protein COEREDRAFT_10893 [Coemansia reversa NRRL 1564]|uniref:Uncharacterized protein n=1 Tax=Coemansia reversa (strain ATCC 12441 / NRRL 1564) TaxID=763665 RepID=A0A2G5B4M8_COERN|nr:hypothetical protein COEREDRAFT_10893 [Coemansia reversa NRRL 1564]|eukprot:PIA13956.1 hypothetical protein COEREDRAFT_10893 [Coemansia reversa NRRL 1564]
MSDSRLPGLKPQRRAGRDPISGGPPRLSAAWHYALGDDGSRHGKPEISLKQSELMRPIAWTVSDNGVFALILASASIPLKTQWRCKMRKRRRHALRAPWTKCVALGAAGRSKPGRRSRRAGGLTWSGASVEAGRLRRRPFRRWSMAARVAAPLQLSQTSRA